MCPLFLAVFLSASCSTISDTIGDWPNPTFYAGFRADLYTAREGGHPPRVFGIVGAPFSFVGDTLLLPVNLVLWLAGCEGESW